jgi:mannose-1-phosphate guanylyltransferase/mannose-6-phosphate isomerase
MTGMFKARPVILCGVSGTRLWPLLRSGFPKQFLCLTGTASFFLNATKRLMGLSCEGINVCSPFIVPNEEHGFLALEQLCEIGIEPGADLPQLVARNTTPALTLAALAAIENGDDPVLLVTPADQTMADAGAYNGAMHDAICDAAEGAIVLGVPPTALKPATATSRPLLDSRLPWWSSGLSKNPIATAKQYLQVVRPLDRRQLS